MAMDNITREAGKNLDNFLNGLIMKAGEKFGNLIEKCSEVTDSALVGIGNACSSALGVGTALTAGLVGGAFDRGRDEPQISAPSPSREPEREVQSAPVTDKYSVNIEQLGQFSAPPVFASLPVQSQGQGRA